MEIDCQAGLGTPYQSETSTPTVRGGAELPLPLIHATYAEVPVTPTTYVTPPAPVRTAIVEPPVKRTAGTNCHSAQHCTV